MLAVSTTPSGTYKKHLFVQMPNLSVFFPVKLRTALNTHGGPSAGPGKKITVLGHNPNNLAGLFLQITQNFFKTFYFAQFNGSGSGILSSQSKLTKFILLVIIVLVVMSQIIEISASEGLLIWKYVSQIEANSKSTKFASATFVRVSDDLYFLHPTIFTESSMVKNIKSTLLGCLSVASSEIEQQVTTLETALDYAQNKSVFHQLYDGFLRAERLDHMEKVRIKQPVIKKERTYQAAVTTPISEERPIIFDLDPPTFNFIGTEALYAVVTDVHESILNPAHIMTLTNSLGAIQTTLKSHVGIDVEVDLNFLDSNYDESTGRHLVPDLLNTCHMGAVYAKLAAPSNAPITVTIPFRALHVETNARAPLPGEKMRTAASRPGVKSKSSTYKPTMQKHTHLVTFVNKMQSDKHLALVVHGTSPICLSFRMHRLTTHIKATTGANVTVLPVTYNLPMNVNTGKYHVHTTLLLVYAEREGEAEIIQLSYALSTDDQIKSLYLDERHTFLVNIAKTVEAHHNTKFPHKACKLNGHCIANIKLEVLPHIAKVLQQSDVYTSDWLLNKELVSVFIGSNYTVRGSMTICPLTFNVYFVFTSRYTVPLSYTLDKPLRSIGTPEQPSTYRKIDNTWSVYPTALQPLTWLFEPDQYPKAIVAQPLTPAAIDKAKNMAKPSQRNPSTSTDETVSVSDNPSDGWFTQFVAGKLPRRIPLENPSNDSASNSLTSAITHTTHGTAGTTSTAIAITPTDAVAVKPPIISTSTIGLNIYAALSHDDAMDEDSEDTPGQDFLMSQLSITPVLPASTTSPPTVAPLLLTTDQVIEAAVNAATRAATAAIEKAALDAQQSQQAAVDAAIARVSNAAAATAADLAAATALAHQQAITAAVAQAVAATKANAHSTTTEQQAETAIVRTTIPVPAPDELGTVPEESVQPTATTTHHLNPLATSLQNPLAQVTANVIEENAAATSQITTLEQAEILADDLQATIRNSEQELITSHQAVLDLLAAIAHRKTAATPDELTFLETTRRRVRINKGKFIRLILHTTVGPLTDKEIIENELEDIRMEIDDILFNDPPTARHIMLHLAFLRAQSAWRLDLLNQLNTGTIRPLPSNLQEPFQSTDTSLTLDHILLLVRVESMARNIVFSHSLIDTQDREPLPPDPTKLFYDAETAFLEAIAQHHNHDHELSVLHQLTMDFTAEYNGRVHHGELFGSSPFPRNGATLTTSTHNHTDEDPRPNKHLATEVSNPTTRNITGFFPPLTTSITTTPPVTPLTMDVDSDSRKRHHTQTQPSRK